MVRYYRNIIELIKPVLKLIWDSPYSYSYYYYLSDHSISLKIKFEVKWVEKCQI